MSDERTQNEDAEPAPLSDQATPDSVIAEAAALLVMWAERHGMKAHALFFACASAPSLAGPEFPLILGPMRYSFMEAFEDARPFLGCVSFVVKYAHPDFPATIADYERAMREREAGLPPGALRSEPEPQPERALH